MGAKRQWHLFSTDQSGAETRYPCALADLDLLCSKLEACQFAEGDLIARGNKSE